MNDMDLTELLPAVIGRYASERGSSPFPIFLTLPGGLPKLPRDYGCMEEMLCAFIESAVSEAHSERPIRMAALKKKRLEDLESLLHFQPSCWVQLKLEVRSPDPIENAVRELPEKFGFRRQDDWVSEESDSRLISYTRGTVKSPVLIVWLEGHKANHKCSLLIPIAARQAS